MTPIQMNPMASHGLAEMYRQQRAIMQQSQQVSEAARTGNVDTLQGVQAAQATQAVNDLLAGKDIPLHQAMIAMQEAGVAFQLMVEVRNKLLEGYQELMRMQV